MRPRGVAPPGFGLRAGRRGVSLVELLVGILVMSFVVAATARLLDVGRRQQRLGRGYSQAQTDLREALRVATRAVRHGYEVKNPSAAANFPVTASSASQAIVRVPGGVEVRLHVSNGVFYAQRSDQAAPGRALITGVQSATFSYFRTLGDVRTAVDGTPQQANELEIDVSARRETIVTRVRAGVTLRNAIAGLF